MPKIIEAPKIPATLRPYLFHGLDLDWTNGDNAIGTCPWCGKDNKFSVKVDNGLWRCYVCNEGSDKGGGNDVRFLRLLWERSDAQESDDNKLAADRKLLWPDTVNHWGLCQSMLTGEWLAPGYNTKGNLAQLYQWTKDSKTGRMRFLPTPKMAQWPFGTVNHDKPTIIVCYADDTEVLTESGWKLFSSLDDDDKLAAYNKEDSTISFELPVARQKIEYVGPMVNVKSRWVDLLVTPEHRMLYRWSRLGNPMIKVAGSLGRMIELPVSGYCDTCNSGPTPLEARLLTAFVADGCIRRGFQIEFSFKKDRKKIRLKDLLNQASVPYEVRHWGSEHESILVDRRKAEFFLRHCPEKTWTESILGWPIESRQSLLEELGYWDGDFGPRNTRYFTSKLGEADLISRVAILTGWSSQMRSKRSKFENGADEHIVSLMDTRWRSLNNKPKWKSYNGYVYCATVSTGFLVVRRKGKAVVSGNCEGPWDAMVLWEVMRSAKESGDRLTLTANDAQSLFAQASIIAVPNCGSVGEPFRKWLPLFAKKHVVLMFDSDHPRQHNGQTVKPAGFEATKRAVNLMASVPDKPETVSWLKWGPDGYDSATPSGFDVRDFLTRDEGGKYLDQVIDRIQRLKTLLDKVELVPSEWSAGRISAPTPNKPPEPDCKQCESWDELVNAWRKALAWNPSLDKVLAVSLAVATSTDLLGDQLWARVVGPPSSAKSTICEALAVAKQYVLSKSTLRGFHSGYRETSDKAEDNSLVAIANNKTLIIKDGDTLLQAPNRDQILAEARDIYDRVSRTHYRNKASKDYEGLNITFILCGTEALRALDTSELGERMLDCVIGDVDPDSEREVALRVAYRAAREMSSRADGKMETRDGPDMVLAKRLTGGYVNYLRENGPQLLKQIPDEEWWLAKCVELGTFIAYMRARPSLRQREKAQRELSYRLTAQLVRLSKCVAVVMGRQRVDEMTIARTREIALDTGRGKTYELIEKLLIKGTDGATTKALSIWLGQDEMDLKNYLNFLRKIKVLKLVERTKSKIHVWKLSPEIIRVWEEVVDA